MAWEYRWCSGKGMDRVCCSGDSKIRVLTDLREDGRGRNEGGLPEKWQQNMESPSARKCVTV